MWSPEEWHADQYAGPNRSTAHLREFVMRVLADEEHPTEALEGGCGGGAKMLHLSDMFPDAHWTGVDRDDEFIRIGREHLDPRRFTMLHVDLDRLAETFGPRRFDISFSIMTLSWIADYESAIQQMLTVTRKWLFILNLFSESELDAFVQMRSRMSGPQEGLNSFYNIYSLPRFLTYCRQLGATQVVAEPFEIDIDIPRPDHRGMGTWTERTADGRRLQFSGPLAMPWWFVAVRAPLDAGTDRAPLEASGERSRS
jgi:ubiquinone/menaquinone biosynthesis C-methylase UbiE